MFQFDFEWLEKEHPSTAVKDTLHATDEKANLSLVRNSLEKEHPRKDVKGTLHVHDKNTAVTLSGNSVQVKIRNISGDNVATLDATKATTVIKIKQQLADSCHIPCGEQTLLCGTSILKDIETIGFLGSPSELQLVRMNDERVTLKINQLFGMSIASSTTAACSVSAKQESTLHQVKHMIEKAIGVPAGEQKLIVQGFGAWEDRRQLLGNICKKAWRLGQDSSLSVTVHCIDADRVSVMEALASGDMDVHSIDAEMFRPAC